MKNKVAFEMEVYVCVNGTGCWNTILYVNNVWNTNAHIKI
jgi:hypothetical protein